VVSSILQFLWVVGSVGDFLLIFEVVFLIGFLFFLFFFCGGFLVFHVLRGISR
jgi:hypothetical protein